MAETLPSEIVVTETLQGINYRLPQSQMGWLRALGVLPPAFGLVVLGAVGVMVGMIAKDTENDPSGFIVLICTSVMMMPFCLLSLGGFFIGVWLLSGHDEIELTASKLKRIMRVGPFRWSRWRRRDKVRRLTVILRKVHTGTRFDLPEGIGRRLQAECMGAPPLTLASGFPHDWLLALANDLSGHCLPLPMGTPGHPVYFAEEIARIGTNQDSRRWRSGSNWVMSRLGYIFFGTFVLNGGVGLLVLVGLALAGGLRGLEYLLLLIPLPFLAFGIGGLKYIRANRTTSPERQNATAIFSLEDDSGRAATLDYPTVPDVQVNPSTRLPVLLATNFSPGWAVIGLLVLLLICSGLLTPLVRIAVNAYLQGQSNLGLFTRPDFTRFLTLFLSLFWLLLIFHLFRQLLLSRVGMPVVEISAHPLYPGGEYRLWFRQSGPLRLNRLRVRIVCQEEATVGRRNGTHPLTRCVHQQEVVREEEVSIGRGTPYEVEYTFRIPEGAMHSFEASQNKVKWKVVVEEEVAWRPNFQCDFPLVVYPSRGQGETA